MEKPSICDTSNIILSMAGSGNPWDYFQPSSKMILRALHDGYSLAEIQELLHVSKEEISEKVNPLINASLLKRENGKIHPTFLIVDGKETEKTFHHSERIGRLISNELKKNFSGLTRQFSELEISNTYSIDDLSLVLIGSKILDIGLLEALVKDRALLRPAPKRPSPARPDAQYYFFMIDGQPEYLGKYGEDSIDLPWEKWTFVTFGQNVIDGRENIPREQLEERCNKALKKKDIKNPEDLAEALNVPLLSREDSLAWKKTSMAVANRILIRLKKRERELTQFYNYLKASSYASSSLGEFVCWYIHIAYSWAIDFLVEEGIISMPDERFGSLIIFAETPEGLLAP